MGLARDVPLPRLASSARSARMESGDTPDSVGMNPELSRTGLPADRRVAFGPAHANPWETDERARGEDLEND